MESENVEDGWVYVIVYTLGVFLFVAFVLGFAVFYTLVNKADGVDIAKGVASALAVTLASTAAAFIITYGVNFPGDVIWEVENSE